MRNFLFFSLLFALSFTLTTALLSAAVPATTPAPPKLLPIINITQSDGATLHGKLVSADLDAVTIQVTGDSTKKDPISVPWANIKKISNGLTRDKVVAQWKADHKDQLCQACNGDRFIRCDACKGTGKDLASRANCPACKGAGFITCAAAKCDKGQIPCPGPCLKRSVGNWYQKPDGTWWCKFPGWEWSEHHIGQVIVIKNGKSTGETAECPLCHGKATIECATCHGSGRVPCDTCAKSDAPLCNNHCDRGIIKCPTCEGTGLQKPAQ